MSWSPPPPWASSNHLSGCQAVTAVAWSWHSWKKLFDKPRPGAAQGKRIRDTNSTTDEASVCLLVCLWCFCVLWPVQLFSWRKKKSLKVFFIFFYVLWFSLVPICNSWKLICSASPRLFVTGDNNKVIKSFWGGCGWCLDTIPLRLWFPVLHWSSASAPLL